MSLGLNLGMIARIEADRIYSLILPETDGHETVTVPLTYLANVKQTAERLETYAPNYIKKGLEKLEETTTIRKWRRKAVVPKESLALLAAAFRIAAEAADAPSAP